MSSSTAVAQTTWGMNLRPLSPAQADKMVELGASTARVVFGWDTIEPNCKGCFSWQMTDDWVLEARRTRLSIFGTLAYAPGWANGGQPFIHGPLNDRDWFDFVYATVLRYRDDVTLWGIWNEANLDVYFHGGDPVAYERLVRVAAEAIHAANPAAKILGPEVSHHAFKDGWYVRVMRDVGDLFDIVTVHWYADGPELEFMMDRMVRPFTNGRPVWLTEAGMKPCETAFGETGQAAFYNRVLTAMLARRSWWTGVMFYDLYDPPEPLDCGSGITRPHDYSNRPAFTLYQSVIRAYR